VDGERVPSCAYLSGSVHLAAGKTIILAMRNVSNGDPRRYVEYVFGWENPSLFTSWQGAQYFGDASAVGQTYVVDLMAVDLSAATAAHSQHRENTLVYSGKVLDSVTVQRVAGKVDNDCVGP
jgi:serine/threonine-protein kinase